MPTNDPADVPITTSAPVRSTPASASPASIPNFHAIPVTPPPPHTSALPPMRTSAKVPTGYGQPAVDRHPWARQ